MELSFSASGFLHGLPSRFKWRSRRSCKKQHQALAIEKRNATIYENVKYFVSCGYSRPVWLRKDPVSECVSSWIMFREMSVSILTQNIRPFPSCTIFKDMARGEERRGLTKKERMQQNLTPQGRDSLERCCHRGFERLQKVKPLNNQINIRWSSR